MDISYAEVAVDEGGTSILLYTVNVFMKEGLICQYALATQSKALKPHIGCQMCYTV